MDECPTPPGDDYELVWGLVPTVESPDDRFTSGEDFLSNCAAARCSESLQVADFVVKQLKEVRICMVEGCSNDVVQFAFGVVDEEPWRPSAEDRRLTPYFLGVCADHPLDEVIPDNEICPEDWWFWLERRGDCLYPRPLTQEGRAYAELNGQLSVAMKEEKANGGMQADHHGQHLWRLK